MNQPAPSGDRPSTTYVLQRTLYSLITPSRIPVLGDTFHPLNIIYVIVHILIGWPLFIANMFWFLPRALHQDLRLIFIKASKPHRP